MTLTVEQVIELGTQLRDRFNEDPEAFIAASEVAVEEAEKAVEEAQANLEIVRAFIQGMGFTRAGKRQGRKRNADKSTPAQEPGNDDVATALADRLVDEIQTEAPE